MKPQESVVQDRVPPNLYDLPPELLDQIMFFLPPSSMVHLMVNRQLRFICENYIYRIIRVVGHPLRSLHLVKTFVLRPDLALLVQDLEINLEWCRPRVVANYNLPALLQPDGLAALSLARNIRALSVGRLEWLSDPSLAHIRGIFPQLNLTSLSIADWFYDNTSDDLPTSRMVIENLRAILRSQPLLEYLSLKSYHVKAPLLGCIEAEDVPNLRRFRGPIRAAEAFLNSAPKLDNLQLTSGYNVPYYILSREPQNGHKIRNLSISLSFNQVRDWDDLGNFLAYFPNTEKLKFVSLSLVDINPTSSHFENIAPQLCRLPLLRKLEISDRGTIFGEPNSAEKALLLFKKHCPSLERFGDRGDSEWVYIPPSEDGGDFRVKLDCHFDRRSFSHASDLPTLEWDV